MPKSDKSQPLLEGNQLSHMVSVRFCVHRDPCCCYICCPTCKCCQEQFENATQIVVPETTTVEEFLHTINRMFSPKTEYAAAFINGYQLKNSDLIAPTNFWKVCSSDCNRTKRHMLLLPLGLTLLNSQYHLYIHFFLFVFERIFDLRPK